MSAIEKVSLTTRLERLRKCYPAFAEFPCSAVKAFSETRMSAYFSGFTDEKKRLGELLGMDDIDWLRYMDIAYLIYEHRRNPQYRRNADEAALLLAVPIQHLYNRIKEQI